MSAEQAIFSKNATNVVDKKAPPPPQVNYLSFRSSYSFKKIIVKAMLPPAAMIDWSESIK